MRADGLRCAWGGRCRRSACCGAGYLGWTGHEFDYSAWISVRLTEIDVPDLSGMNLMGTTYTFPQVLTSQDSCHGDKRPLSCMVDRSPIK